LSEIGDFFLKSSDVRPAGSLAKWTEDRLKMLTLPIRIAALKSAGIAAAFDQERPKQLESVITVG
jgi:hypothetical protein